jgi:dTMP kinase
MPFITFEGIDGSGKSSLLDNFASELKSRDLPVEITREPGGSILGRDLRKILLQTTGEKPCPEAELLLYLADRAQHVTKKIMPWLKEGKWVLSDRFIDSSIAFQGAGRKISISDVQLLNTFATGGLLPELTVIVDCPIEISGERLEKRLKEKNTELDRFEKEKSDFHQAVRDEYLKLSKTHSRFFVLDGRKTQKELSQEFLNECLRRKIL